MFGIGLGQFQRGQIALGQVHAPQVRPTVHGDRLRAVPVAVRQAAEQPHRQPLGFAGQPLAAVDEQRGKPRVQHLHQRSPTPDSIRTAAAAPRNVLPQQAQAASKSCMACSMSPRLKASSPSLPRIWALGIGSFGQDRGRLEQLAGRVVAAAEHEHVAQPFGNPVTRAARSASAAPRWAMRYCCSADFQGVLGAGLLGRLQGVGQARWPLSPAASK